MNLPLAEIYAYDRDTFVKWTRFGSGEPLIFCHGTPWSSQLWAPFASCLAQRFEVYLYDMPGYGESVMDPALELKPLYPFQTRVFCALLKHWKRESGQEDFQPHVIAHDIGGHIALRAHLIEEMSFSSLLLVDCGASVAVDEAFFSLVRENSSVFTQLPAYLHEAMLREYIRSASYKGLKRHQEDMLIEPWLVPNGQKAFYSQIAAQRNSDINDLRSSFRKLDIPLRIVWGRNDKWVPVERAERLQTLVGGTVKIIENAGHLIQLDAAEELMFEIMDWTQQCS